MNEIGYESRERIAYVTLNRPAAKNAVTPDMHREMCRVWADFRDSDEADVAILTGVGDAFVRAPISRPTCRSTTSTPSRAAFGKSST
jgi:enoyl-CoA hydratase/carnithine racemase